MHSFCGIQRILLKAGYFPEKEANYRINLLNSP